MFKQYRRSLAALMGLFCLSSVQAQQEALDTMTVTASRIPQTVDETLSSVSVITRADIERKQAQTVLDALRGVPGIDLTNRGGPGQLSSISLRGTETRHVLVMIDGIKVSSVDTGLTQFERIPIDQIERIEVVRGPRTSLYGSEAIGGVIQIFTRKGADEELKPHFNIGGSGGDLDSFKASAGVSGRSTHGWFNLNLSGYNTPGINACNTPTGVFAGCFTNEPDRDGSDYVSGSLRAGYDLGDDASIDFNILRTDGFLEFDGAFQNESEYKNTVAGLRFSFKPVQNWRVTANAGLSRSDTENLLNGAFINRFDTTRHDLSLQNDVTVAPGHVITAGIDIVKDELDSTLPYTVTSRDNYGYFSQYLGELGRFNIQGSVRHDDNEQFGGYTTGNIGLGMDVTSSVSIYASYGTAFTAPSFDFLYFPGFSNPNLDPETSESYEVGLRGDHNLLRWSINAYRTNIENLIQNQFTGPVNIADSRIDGLEATAGTMLLGFDINASLTWMDPENRTAGPNFGNVLVRRAREQFNIDIDRNMGDFSAGASIKGVGSRYDDPANTVKLDSYLLVDLRGEYRFNKAWRLQARIANLLDEEYETVAFFNQPGRTAFLTLRYQP